MEGYHEPPPHLNMPFDHLTENRFTLLNSLSPFPIEERQCWFFEGEYDYVEDKLCFLFQCHLCLFIL